MLSLHLYRRHVRTVQTMKMIASIVAPLVVVALLLGPNFFAGTPF